MKLSKLLSTYIHWRWERFKFLHTHLTDGWVLIPRESRTKRVWRVDKTFNEDLAETLMSEGNV